MPAPWPTAKSAIFQYLMCLGLPRGKAFPKHLEHEICDPARGRQRLASSGSPISHDRHGAVVVPYDAVEKIPAAIDLLTRREAVVIEASKRPGFSIEDLRKAFSEQAEIH